MNGTVAGFGYEAIASGRIQQLKSAMDAIIAAELQFMVPIIKALLVMFVVRQFTLTWTGNMTVERFVGSSVRAAVVVFLISHSGAFAQYVRDPIFDKIPQAVSSTILSAGGVQTTAGTSLARQFDKASASADKVTAAIVARETGFSVSALVNNLSARFANDGIQLMLSAICGIWMLGQSLLAIILCFGPLLLGFELFDRTRGWVDQWIGKLVGMTCFGIGTSILLGIQMTGLQDMLKSIEGNLPSGGAEASAALMRVCCNIVLDLFTMGALPAICAIGSGVAASLAVPAVMPQRAAASAARAAAAALARNGNGAPRARPGNAVSRS